MVHPTTHHLGNLNLSRNPFGELEAHEIAELAIVDPNPWLTHLQDEPALLQFIGDKGRGKTTCLRYLVAHLAPIDYIHLPEIGSRRFTIKRPLVIDEAQRLDWFTRRTRLGDRRIRAIATHDDLSRLASKQGRQVLTIPVPCRIDHDFLLQVLRKRIERFRISDAPVPEITPNMVNELTAQFGDNLRLIISHLYDCIQVLDQPGPFQVTLNLTQRP